MMVWYSSQYFVPTCQFLSFMKILDTRLIEFSFIDKIINLNACANTIISLKLFSYVLNIIKLFHNWKIVYNNLFV